ncbi:hypothetical protein D3C85_1096800 [compost metagenome]
MIPNQVDALLSFIKNTKSKNAIQFSKGSFLPMLIGIQNYLGIGLCFKNVAQVNEFSADLLVIINLTIVSNYNIFFVAYHRLMTTATKV